MVLARIEGYLNRNSNHLEPNLTTTTEVIRREMSRQKVPQPTSGYYIGEDDFYPATYSSTAPFLLTSNLVYCKALAFMKPESQSAVLSHITTYPDMRHLLNDMETSLGYPLEECNAALLSGYYGKPTTLFSRVVTRIDPPKTIEFEKIVRAVLSRRPRSFVIDESRGNTLSRGVVVDLLRGEMKEMDIGNGWVDPKTYHRSRGKLYL